MTVKENAKTKQKRKPAFAARLLIRTVLEDRECSLSLNGLVKLPKAISRLKWFLKRDIFKMLVMDSAAARRTEWWKQFRQRNEITENSLHHFRSPRLARSFSTSAQVTLSTRTSGNPGSTGSRSGCLTPVFRLNAMRTNAQGGEPDERPGQAARKKCTPAAHCVKSLTGRQSTKTMSQCSK